MESRMRWKSGQQIIWSSFTNGWALLDLWWDLSCAESWTENIEIAKTLRSVLSAENWTVKQWNLKLVTHWQRGSWDFFPVLGFSGRSSLSLFPLLVVRNIITLSIIIIVSTFFSSASSALSASTSSASRRTLPTVCSLTWLNLDYCVVNTFSKSL